ncbi:MAG TPA: hypothetical protein VD767_12315 [Thermomicrobiales bacterium]|nr:hypothetical protein [Thermomicrobiales bacterium]
MRPWVAIAQVPGLLAAIGLVMVVFTMAPMPAAAQGEGTNVDVSIANCEHEPPPDEGPILGEQGELPDYCEMAGGVTVTIYDLDGDVLATCTTDSNGTCDNLLVPVDQDTEVVVEVDESTVKSGYAPIRNSFTTVLFPFEGTAEVNVINIPEETSELPDTGAGTGARTVPGSLTANVAGALAVLAVILVLGGAMLRRPDTR